MLNPWARSIIRNVQYLCDTLYFYRNHFFFFLLFLIFNPIVETNEHESMRLFKTTIAFQGMYIIVHLGKVDASWGSTARVNLVRARSKLPRRELHELHHTQRILNSRWLVITFIFSDQTIILRFILYKLSSTSIYLSTENLIIVSGIRAKDYSFLSFPWNKGLFIEIHNYI